MNAIDVQDSSYGLKPTFMGSGIKRLLLEQKNKKYFLRGLIYMKTRNFNQEDEGQRIR